MSKHDPLSNEEHAVAASQGWMVCRIFEGERSSLRIHPAVFGQPFRHVEAAYRFVAAQAARGDRLAIKALTLTVLGAVKATTKPKKRKAKA